MKLSDALARSNDEVVLALEASGVKARWDNTWVVCGAIAGSTVRIRVGPGIVNPYSCSMPEIAMGAASLDNLSNGRCVLGIGSGAKHLLLEGRVRQPAPPQTQNQISGTRNLSFFT